MEFLRSLKRVYILFQNVMINLFYHYKSLGKFKDKEHLKLICSVHVGPGG